MNRYIIDPNLLISAFLFPGSIPRQAFDRITEKSSLLASDETYKEFAEVFILSKFEKYVPIVNRKKIIDDLRDLLTFSPVSITITACRDPKDNKFPELAVAAKSSCIITGDDDLLVLHPLSAGQAGFRGIPIVNANDFLDMRF